MAADAQPDSDFTQALLEAVRSGERDALAQLFDRQRRDLLAFVDRHLDPRLRKRIDPSDVVQDTQLEMMRRMDDYLTRRPMPFRLWARKQTYERILRLRRDHLARARRSAQREVPWPDRSSVMIAGPLLRSASSPSAKAEARELARRVSAAVAQLGTTDREILLMRHAEDLPYGEIGYMLEIEPAAARQRYGRAMIRLQRLLTEQGLLE